MSTPSDCARNVANPATCVGASVASDFFEGWEGEILLARDLREG